ncbi:MAG: hypothetical protein VZQ83_01400, partial [Eubacterium sp.]|nr:hypothetical protein [Eubacterium sp.]
IYESDRSLNMFDVSVDGKYILLRDESKVSVSDSDSKEVLYEIERQSEDADSMFDASFCGTNGFVVIDGTSRSYYSLNDRDLTAAVTLPEEISDYTSFYQDPDTGTTIVCGTDSLLAIGDRGEITYRVDIADIFKKNDLEITGVSFEKKLAVATYKDGSTIYIVVFDKASGKPVYHHREKKDDSVVATVYGNTLCYVASGHDGSGDELVTRAVAVDLRSGKKKWEAGLPGETAVEVTHVNDSIYVRGGGFVTGLSTAGDVMPTMYTETPIVSTWTETTSDGITNYYYLCSSGKLFAYDGSESNDSSERVFRYVPTLEVSQAKRGGEALFYRPFTSDYIIKYASEIPDTAEEVGEEFTGEYPYADTEFIDSENAEKIIASVEGLDPKGGEQVFFSNDKKYLCVYGRDSLDIVDMETKKLIQTLEVTVDSCDGMRYSEISKGYIIDSPKESFVLDRNFNIVCTADRIVGEDKGGFVMLNNDNSKYYKVPYVSYDEVVERVKTIE